MQKGTLIIKEPTSPVTITINGVPVTVEFDDIPDEVEEPEQE